MKTNDYLNMINKMYDIKDYKTAKLLKTGTSTISSYRSKKRFFDDDIAIKVAELLDINPEIVLADIHAERA